MTNTDFEQDIQKIQNSLDDLTGEIQNVIVGHDQGINQLITALLSRGHVLLEGVPGLGKTLLVKTLAKALNLTFRRIQFTPDLMPADILGTEVFHEDKQGNRHFEFRKGPIFGNLILADEINRATPKTQSALLQAMQEQAVTTMGKKRTIKSPFFVVATQNPIEMEGTYPLPEAQIDRFFFKTILNRPDQGDTVNILERTTTSSIPEAEPQLDTEQLKKLQQTVRNVTAVNEILAYAANLVDSTHADSELAPDSVKQYVQHGSSPRGAQALILSAKVTALQDGRAHASFEDIRSCAVPALRHRILLNFEGEAESISTDSIIRECIEAVPEMNERTEKLLNQLE